jgi:hypothetical protein
MDMTQENQNFQVALLIELPRMIKMNFLLAYQINLCYIALNLA